MDENKIVLTILALLPAIALGIYIYKKDKAEKEPIPLLLLLLGLGVLSCFPSIWGEELMDSIINSIFSGVTPTKATVYIYFAVVAFIGVALVEELFKWIMLTVATVKNKHFNSLFDGIIYSIFVSLGFAAYENILYAVNNGFQTALLRMVTAVPAHMFFAVFMGYYYSWWHVKKLAREKEREYKQMGLIPKDSKEFSFLSDIILSLLMPILVHGFYDFCAFVSTPVTTVIFYLFLAFLYVFCFMRIRKMSKQDASDQSVVMAMLIKKYPELANAGVAEPKYGPDDKKYRWPSGAVYIGQWAGGIMNGKGTMKYPNNDKYIGEFCDGKRSGQGTYIYSDGGRFIGNWKDDFMEGEGKYFAPDGTVTEGVFEKGAKIA